jgi:cell division protein FtsW (lipid II flippase)
VRIWYLLLSLSLAMTLVSTFMLRETQAAQDPKSEKGKAFRRRWRSVLFTAAGVVLIASVGLWRS